MAHVIAFSTFLKFIELTATPRKSAMRKLLSPGGFSYWSPLQRSAQETIEPYANLGELEARIDAVCSGVRAKYNKNGLKRLFDWGQTKSLVGISAMPKLIVPFGSSGLSVQLKPELSFSDGEEQYSMAIWATTKPLLSNPTLSIGLLFLSRAYRTKGSGKRRFCIFDTIANKLFGETDILPNTAILLKIKHDEFKKNWTEVNGVPSKPTTIPKGEQPKLPRR